MSEVILINQQNNREMFEPFIEDDVPFDDYCQNMEKDGTWAGHMELQAASLVSRFNICIHRVSPLLCLIFVPCIHVDDLMTLNLLFQHKFAKCHMCSFLDINIKACKKTAWFINLMTCMQTIS